MQYYLPLRKFTFAHSHTQGIAVIPTDEQELTKRGPVTPCRRLPGEEQVSAGVAINTNTSATPSCCCPLQTAMPDVLLSAQDPTYWSVEAG